jgi:sialidase-1
MIISDDHGASWRIGGVPGNYGNETCIAQVNDNEIYVNMRSSRHNNQRPYCREVVWSRDGGDTFGAAKHDCELPGSICQGSLLAFRNGEGGKDLIFCNPASQRREQLRVRRSQDGGKSWSRGRLIYGGSAAYSDLVQIDQSRLGVLFERDLYEAITFTTVSLESL